MTGNFELPLSVDLGATAAFALTGAFAGVRRRYDIVGVFFLALASGVGGGLIRDGLFLRQSPPVAITDSRYLVTVALACAAGLVLGGRMRHFERWITIVDALGLGAYAVVGAQKTLQAGLGVPAALLIGVINAAGGGLLRDVLSREEPLIFKPGQFYALAALAGAACFVSLAVLGGVSATASAGAAIGFTFLLRMLTIRFKWRTRPAASEPVEPDFHS
jgi:uncharacterized membrane protein YeiH